MNHRAPRRMDIYSELCPVSSAMIIGAGLITVIMGSVFPGLAFVAAGVAVGIAGPMSKTLKERRYPVKVRGR